MTAHHADQRRRRPKHDADEADDQAITEPPRPPCRLGAQVANGDQADLPRGEGAGRAGRSWRSNGQPFERRFGRAEWRPFHPWLAALQLDHAVLARPFGPDGQLPRHADQVGGSANLPPGPHRPVSSYSTSTCRVSPSWAYRVFASGRDVHSSLAALQIDDDRRRYGATASGQMMPPVVVAGLDDGAQQTRHADAITEPIWTSASCTVRCRRPWPSSGLRIFRAEIEDVTDLDAPRRNQTHRLRRLCRLELGR